MPPHAPPLSRGHRPLLIANPRSGRGRGTQAARLAAARLRQLGCEPALLLTSYAGHAAEATRQALVQPDLRLRPSCIVAVGGDGTVSEIARGLLACSRLDVPIGIIPLGTGNVLAKEYRIPRGCPRRAAEVVAAGHTRELDLVAVTRPLPQPAGPAWMLAVGSVGLDGTVVRRFHAARDRAWIPGVLHYVWLALGYLLRGWTPRLRVEVDGVSCSGEYAWVLVGNTAAYGGPLTWTPMARPDDARLEVIAIAPGYRWRSLSLLWQLLRRRPQNDRAVTHWQAGRSVRIESVAGYEGMRDDVQIDGEPAGSGRITFAMMPQRLRILCPPPTSATALLPAAGP